MKRIISIPFFLCISLGLVFVLMNQLQAAEGKLIIYPRSLPTGEGARSAIALRCARAYEKISNAYNQKKEMGIAPFCSQTFGFMGPSPYKVECFSLGRGTGSGTASPLAHAIRSHDPSTRHRSDYTICKDDPRGDGRWPPDCYTMGEIEAEIEWHADTLRARGYTYPEIMDPVNDVNDPLDAYYDRIITANPGFPFWVLEPGRDFERNILVFRGILGYECARQAFTILRGRGPVSRGKTIMCISERIDSFESGCR